MSWIRQWRTALPHMVRLPSPLSQLVALDGVVAALVDHRAEVAGVMDVAVAGTVADSVQLDAGLVADVDAAVVVTTLTAMVTTASASAGGRGGHQ